MFFKAIERGYIIAITHGSKTFDSYIDSNGSCCWMSGSCDFSFGLDGDKPFFSTFFDCNITQFPYDFSAFAVMNPAEFWKKDAAIVQIEFNLCRIRKTKAASLPFLLET